MAEVAAVNAVAPVHQVLAALQDPVRLEMVRRLRNAGAPVKCQLLYDGINKSTATHHFKILREAGSSSGCAPTGRPISGCATPTWTPRSPVCSMPWWAGRTGRPTPARRPAGWHCRRGCNDRSPRPRRTAT